MSDKRFDERNELFQNARAALDVLVSELDEKIDRVAELEEVMVDFQKCSDVALRLSSLYPESSDAWTGTVSERILKGVENLRTELATLRDENARLQRRTPDATETGK